MSALGGPLRTSKKVPSVPQCLGVSRSRAAGRSAARCLGLGLPCADEGAGYAPLDGRRDGVDVESRVAQKAARVFHVVDPRRLDLDLVETGGLELRSVLRLGERASDASAPQLHRSPHFGRNLT